ncbi:uncharacterized protein KY384_002283 [Bacidia gigantensis]|uniref:uncharacterized protein n=1 Tax=Bacidia gigantensis TaxID=2732470 RepID=UPI001D0562D7|nr:uncharacterized protein KY384_002283 [Bacidia gigantensis]KAG8533498.1 hypothetical protein KY384_002283 [Bacidia gigantensis]
MAASTYHTEIFRQDLQALSTPPTASITNIKQLSSYNWIEASASTPTISVPGSPSLWSPPSTPQQLKKDFGLVYMDQNAARHPPYPLETLFRALDVANPSFDPRSTDIITDRNNVRKLLSFINPTSCRKGLEAFTINVEVGLRPRIREGVHYLTDPIPASTGDHGIISYRFGDLNCLVRHETDGYINDSSQVPPSPTSKEVARENPSSISATENPDTAPLITKTPWIQINAQT